MTDRSLLCLVLPATTRVRSMVEERTGADASSCQVIALEELCEEASVEQWGSWVFGREAADDGTQTKGKNERRASQASNNLKKAGVDTHSRLHCP